MDPVGPHPPLRGERSADVLVVGGGYTGMWAADWIRRLEPGADVMLLEARTCGEGPSGRNGGFVNSLWRGLPELRRRFGAQGDDLARLSEDAASGIERWCTDEGVDAHFRRGGYMSVSTCEAQDGEAADVVAAAPHRVIALDPLEVRARCDSPVFRGGVFLPDGATVHPARLARGLRARLGANGVSLAEGTRVIGLDAGAQGVTALTPEGRVRAGAAVIAMGPASAALGPLRRRLTIASSHVLATEPVPDVLERLGWTGGEAITDARNFVHYTRTTRDHRIVFGWGGGHLPRGVRVRGRAEVDRAVAVTAREHLMRFFPELVGRRVEHAWGGPIDVSPTHVPMVVALPGGRAWAAFGYTGNGVGPSRLAGRVLAALALDRRDEHSRLPLVDPPPELLPPEPFRHLGGELVRAAFLRRERLEEEGRRAGPLTQAVCELPRLLGVQLAR